MRKDSRGFTLIELIVVIVILGVMAAVITMSTSIIPATRAKSCASAINTGIDRCRIGSLTHAAVSYLTISQNENGGYVIECYDNSTSPSGYSGGTLVSSTTVSGGITVACKSGGNTLTIVHNAGASQIDKLNISFTRSGALNVGLPDTGGNCVITVTGGGRSYTITVVAATGFHEIS